MSNSIMLNKGQQKALEKTIQAYKRGESHIVISGPAGSGKSFLIKHIISVIEKMNDEYGEKTQVAYVAPTGKAAAVLRQNGNSSAQTIHKFLYIYKQDSETGDFNKHLKAREQLKADIVVVDEVGMVDVEFIKVLQTFDDLFIIYCGDAAQLPPVSKKSDNHLLDNPDITLTEIMRQANGSDIIDIATDVRLGKPLTIYNGTDTKVMSKSSLSTGMLLWADVIICATNKTRAWLNQEVRKLKGYTSDLCEGERLICLHNYDRKLSEIDKEPLVNGTIGVARNIRLKRIRYSNLITLELPVIDLYLEDNSDWYENIVLDTKVLIGDTSMLSWEDKKAIKQYWKIRRKANPKKKITAPTLPYEFTYCQAATCHKLQGSSAPKVLIYEENFPFDKEEHKRWLYTAITRASEKVVVLKK